MDRRSFLALTAAMPLSRFSGPVIFNDGWLPEEPPIIRRPRLCEYSHLQGFGQDKVACLWKPFEKVTGKPWVPRQQLGPDCVAFAAAAAMDILTAVQIVLKKKKEQYITETSTDMIYSGGRNHYARNAGSAGMRAEWVVGYLERYGNLLRQEYGDYDLTPYTKASWRHWDRRGIPQELLTIAKEHPLLESAQVRSWEEFRDAIAGGFPIIFCSSMGGSNSKRDQDGFIRPRGTWYHSWCGAGIQDNKRPGALLINSHGKNYGSGKKTHGQPNGSVWVDAKHIDRHCRQFKDTYALSLYKGFPTIPEQEYILW